MDYAKLADCAPPVSDDPYGTHYAGCEASHRDCWILAAREALRQAEALRAERDELKAAALSVVRDYEALEAYQSRLLDHGLDEAIKNWDEATTMGPSIDLRPLVAALRGGTDGE